MLIAYLEDDLDQAANVTAWFNEFGFEYEHFTHAQMLLKRLKEIQEMERQRVESLQAQAMDVGI